MDEASHLVNRGFRLVFLDNPQGNALRALVA